MTAKKLHWYLTFLTTLQCNVPAYLVRMIEKQFTMLRRACKATFVLLACTKVLHKEVFGGNIINTFQNSCLIYCFSFFIYYLYPPFLYKAQGGSST